MYVWIYTCEHIKQKPTIYTLKTQNNYTYFSKVELQLQINNTENMPGILLISRIIAEINYIDM